MMMPRACNGSAASHAAAAVHDSQLLDCRDNDRAAVCIDLTEDEQKLFDCLLEYVEERGFDVTLRAAGGWVRDKVIGQASNDIDIAIDTLTGKEFAESLREWLKTRAYSHSSFGVIPRNPEQSKHLETATMAMMGFQLDFVNLRTESYTDTRIPVIGSGTPRDDALRRDFTINSLFYNLKTRKVEDFTERGLSDLAAGILRTPLPPVTTLLDDPLRVLRAIRFASRMGLTFADDLDSACRDPSVVEALSAKVSKERIGTEFEKMLARGDQRLAIILLTRCGLLPSILALPSGSEIEPVPPIADLPDKIDAPPLSVDSSWRARGAALALCVAPLISSQKRTTKSSGPLAAYFPDLESHDSNGGEGIKHLCYAALLWPLRYFRYKETKTRRAPLSSHVVVDVLKRSKKDANAVANIHLTSRRVASLLAKSHGAVARGHADPPDRFQPTSTTVKHRRVNGPEGSRASENDEESSGDVEKLSGECDAAAKALPIIVGTAEKVVLTVGVTSSLAGNRRVRIGRTMLAAGSRAVWRSAVALAAAAAVLQTLEKAAESDDNAAPLTTLMKDVGTALASAAMGGVVMPFVKLGEEVMADGREELLCSKGLTPLFKGNELTQEVLPRLPRGPAVKEVLEAQVDWQLQNPDGNKEDCSAFLAAEFPAYAPKEGKNG